MASSLESSLNPTRSSRNSRRLGVAPVPCRVVIGGVLRILPLTCGLAERVGVWRLSGVVVADGVEPLRLGAVSIDSRARTCGERVGDAEGDRWKLVS
jgi:hypothetical protein